MDANESLILRSALSAIAYLDLSHITPEQQVELYKSWARESLKATTGTYTVVHTDLFNEQWKKLTGLTPDTASQ